MNQKKIKKCLLATSVERSGKFGASGKMDKHGLSMDQPQSSWLFALEKHGTDVCLLTTDMPKVTMNTNRNIFQRMCKRIIREGQELLQWRESAQKFKIILSEEKPDFVWVSTNFRALSPRYLAEMKNLWGFKVILSDGLSPKWTRNHIAERYARVADLVLTNSRQNADEYRDLDIKHVICLPNSAQDSRLFASTRRILNDPLCDVAIVGTLDDRLHNKRVKLLQQLTEFNVGIWCPNPPEELEKWGLEKFYKGSVSRTECSLVYSQSRICLNIHGIHMKDGGNLSTFEIPASGAFQIVDACHREWFEDGREIVTFNSIEDLKAKIRYYLANEKERETIAAAGRKRALKEHSYDNRIAKILQMLETI